MSSKYLFLLTALALVGCNPYTRNNPFDPDSVANASNGSGRFWAKIDLSYDVTLQTPVSRFSSGGVAFNGKYWVFGGLNGGNQYNDIWVTSNLTNWTQIPSPAWSQRPIYGALVHNGKVWVIGSNYLNDVWYSSDMTNWTQAATSLFSQARQGFSVVSFNNKLWAIGGLTNQTYFNDVWSSSDGVTWSATSNNPWAGRAYFGLTVFSNQMWILGGHSLSLGNKNDVWSSPDGVNWTRVTAAASWGARGFFSTLVYRGQMWVFGGSQTQTTVFTNDVWSSVDGVNWNKWTGAASWSARNLFTVVPFNNLLVFFGGQTSLNSGNGEIWYSPK